MEDLDTHNRYVKLLERVEKALQEQISQDFIISELKSLLTYYTPPDCEREMMAAVSKVEHESKSNRR